MHPSAPSHRAGFTLAECLVAGTLFAAGLIGLAGTALAVQRLGNASAARAEAATLGMARLERLRGVACARRAAGVASSRGIAEHWSVTATADLTLVRDSLLLPPDRGRPVPPLVLDAALPC